LIRLEAKLENIEKAFGTDLAGGAQGFPVFPNDDEASFQKEDVLILYTANGEPQNIWGPAAREPGLDLSPLHVGEGRGPVIESISIANTDDPVQYVFKIVPLYSGEIFTGYLALGSPLDPAGRLGRLFATLITLICLTLLVSFAGGFWLADRAMRPVKTIASKARSISETDLSQRFNLPKKDEIGQLAETFDSMLGRLEAAFARQRQFTADASHELRTPLTIVNLETTRALSAPRSAKEYQRVLEIVQSENELMRQLVNDLLTLARMDAGREPLIRESLDLSDLALDVVERLAPLAARQAVKLETGGLPEVSIRGDRQSLTQMLTNLVENAIKYTAQNEPGKIRSVLIETGTHPARTVGWVRVTDTGPGIPGEHLDHLFDRFYRVDESRTQNEETTPAGSGLGLAIVQGIAQLHGGRVEVKSEPGKGSTFEITFPQDSLNVKSSSAQ
jgi:heavy metal sensor kinase